MGFLNILFRPKKVEPVRVEYSQIYKQVVHLLTQDFSNWKLDTLSTRVHQPTRIGIACTGTSAFVYVDCNNFNARSGKRVDLVFPENTDLFRILSTAIQIGESEQQLANRKRLEQVLDSYLGEEK